MSAIRTTSITCQVTGEQLAVRPDIFDARVEKYGSIDNLRKTYIGRTARKMIKAGKSVSEVRKELGVIDSGLSSEATLEEAVNAIRAKPLKVSTPKKLKVITTEDLVGDTTVVNEDLEEDADVTKFMSGGALPEEAEVEAESTTSK